jgi:hypothetical protein
MGLRDRAALTVGFYLAARASDLACRARGRAAPDRDDRPGGLGHRHRPRDPGDHLAPPVRVSGCAITPVPGGVGPVTYTWLLRNTVAAARLALGVSPARGRTEGLAWKAADSEQAAAVG